MHAKQGNWDAARTQFAVLIHETCPSNFSLEIGKLALAEKQSDLAIESLTEASRRKEIDSLAALNLLFTHFRRQNNEREMLRCVREMAELERGRPELWWKLLEMLDTRRFDLEFLSALRQALQNELPERDKTEMRHRLVARLVEQGDTEQARHELVTIVDREGRTPRIKLHEAAIERLEGHSSEALKLLTAALAEAGEHPGAVRLRGLIHFDLGMDREAAEEFEKGIEHDPFDLSAHFKLSEAYRRLGQFDLAQKHEAIAQEIRDKRQQINKLRAAVAHTPSDKRLYQQLAELHRELNDPRGAAHWEEQAQDIGDSRPNATETRAAW